jgi:hypothetical protein
MPHQGVSSNDMIAEENFDIAFLLWLKEIHRADTNGRFHRAILPEL